MKPCLTLPVKGFASRWKGLQNMSRSFRRFEMLLPLLFNDGSPVPESLIADTLIELEQKFGTVSSETQTIRGRWHFEGVAYRDELIRVFVDLPDELPNRQFFTEYKEQLKGRFQQIDLWMITYPVEIL
jgi:hypothetical protein